MKSELQYVSLAAHNLAMDAKDTEIAKLKALMREAADMIDEVRKGRTIVPFPSRSLVDKLRAAIDGEVE